MRRLALIAAVSLVTTLLVTSGSPGATNATPPGLALFQFVNSGSGPLPWNAVSMTAMLNGTRMLGGPHTVSNAAEGVIAYRTTTSDIAIYTQPLSGPSQWIDLSTQINTPTPGADPVPFFDPAGALDVLYVDTTGHLIVLSANDAVGPLWSHLHRNAAWRPIIVTDLTALTGVTFANGLASVQVNALSATVAARTLANTIEVIPLAWDANAPIPYLGGAAMNVSALASTNTSTSDPVVLATPVPALVTTSLGGDLMLYAETGPPTSPWVVQDLTTLTAGPKVSGTLASASSPTTAYVAALGANGVIALFSTLLSTLSPPGPGVHAAVTPPSPWSVLNVTAATPSAPPLDGALFLDASTAQVTIAGQAANWGDLFALSNTGPNAAWVATDVSVTAGSSARTVAGVVSGFRVGSTLNLFAAGVASPPPQGVGVYAIPSNKWGQAITDGWPIISETGALGTQSAPWVGYTTPRNVNATSDFLMGQAIYNSHKRVTWLSFWTVSGPLQGEPQNTTNYFNHGFASGAWVASQIDSYRALGVGLKPDWVIFDPEGYPDNHSHLDAPGGSSKATIATYATYWSAMVRGWAAGLASVDPSLNAGVYASQSEYRNYQLATTPLPVFIALAFGSGGPIPVAGASGSNVRGFIAFSATCTPLSALKAQEATLLNPPWGGQFNTLQFNAGVYCAPG